MAPLLCAVCVSVVISWPALITTETQSTLPDPDPVVTIQRRGIRNNHPVAFFKAVENLDSADGIAPEFDARAYRLGPIGCQHKHADGLVCLSESRPSDFQYIREPFQFDSAVNAQIGTSARRQWPVQRGIDFKRAFASSRIDT